MADLGLPDISRLLGARWYFRAWRAVRSGALPARRVGWRYWIRPADLERWLAQRETGR